MQSTASSQSVHAGKTEFRRTPNSVVDRRQTLFYNKVVAIEFRWNAWNAWNVEHIAKHSVTRDEAERVVRNARKHRRHRKGSWIVYGRGNSERKVEVVYVKDPDGTFYVIHAMPYW